MFFENKINLSKIVSEKEKLLFLCRLIRMKTR